MMSPIRATPPRELLELRLLLNARTGPLVPEFEELFRVLSMPMPELTFRETWLDKESLVIGGLCFLAAGLPVLVHALAYWYKW